MSFTVLITQTLTEGTAQITTSTTHVCDTVTKFDESVADAQTNKPYALGIDVSALKAFYLVSDEDVDVFTNDLSSGAPDDTFNLTANDPVLFKEGDTTVFPSAVDVTIIYITNTVSGNAARIQLYAGMETT